MWGEKNMRVKGRIVSICRKMLGKWQDLDGKCAPPQKKEEKINREKQQKINILKVVENETE